MPTSISGASVQFKQFKGKLTVLEELAEDPTVPSSVYVERLHRALRELNELTNDDVVSQNEFRDLSARLIGMLPT